MDVGIQFWIAFSIWMGTEFVIAIRNRVLRRNVSATKKDKGSLFFILFGVWLATAVAFQFHMHKWGWVTQSVANVGVFMMIAGVAFRLWAIRILGQHFSLSVSVDVGQTIVQHGPYKYIRHPAYTGTLITFVGLGIGLNSWIASCVSIMIFLLIYAYRIHVEEAALVSQFQDVYEEYRKRTWKLIPFLY